ncbi:DUF1120 domain-containing protein [Pseudomonas sp. SWRI18]|uniref:DUF1120 domain-containing protein n=1 Tax=Pseudomonas sp. SWRI18 TaxID=2753888 RepID=UPI00164602A4|nr:DUF1120 domain-containing protein [Pseudomonas sp. SWRI18]MBC3300736.1 DUF1120 domain-containing protein [Pseudomonas sp. SWRI18]
MGFNTVLLPLLLLLSASAWGDDECRLNLSESRLDFGLMNRAVAMTPAPERLLGERRISLTLNCPQDQDLSLFYRAPGASAQRYRFTEQGTYRLHVSEAVVDGHAVELGLLAGSGQPPVASGAQLVWRPEHGVVPLRDGVTLRGRSLSLQIDASAWADEAAARVSDAVTWDSGGLFDAIHSGRSRELRLQARFAPAACTPLLSNGGHVDFGKLSVLDLSQNSDTALPARSLAVNVACDAPTAFTLRMQDNRQGSATGGADNTAYGLGLDSRQHKIGRYRLIFDPTRATADSYGALYRTDAAADTGPWSSASASPIAISGNRFIGFSAVPGSTSGPSSIQHLSATASLEAFIAPLGSLDLGNEVRLDGAATLEINYL